ncbi:LOW QUALITY PROTEIN: hypothetical protein RJ641_008760, partial [Dillenia turbinata]
FSEQILDQIPWEAFVRRHERHYRKDYCGLLTLFKDSAYSPGDQSGLTKNSKCMYFASIGSSRFGYSFVFLVLILSKTFDKICFKGDPTIEMGNEDKSGFVLAQGRCIMISMPPEFFLIRCFEKLSCIYFRFFEMDANPRVLCFGLMKNSGDGKSYGKNLAFTPPEYLRIGKECSRRDLTATHEIFEKAGYQDDEGVTDQVGDLKQCRRRTKFFLSMQIIGRRSWNCHDDLKFLAPRISSKTDADLPSAFIGLPSSTSLASLHPPSHLLPSSPSSASLRHQSCSSLSLTLPTFITNARPPLRRPPQQNHLFMVYELFPARYSLEQLRNATSGFSSSNVVPEHGEKTPNVAKRCKIAWPDSRQFLVCLLETCFFLGQLRSEGLANLVRCCCEGDERLLVAEFRPHETLSPSIFSIRRPPTIEMGNEDKSGFVLAQGRCIMISMPPEFFLIRCFEKLSCIYFRFFEMDANPRVLCFGLMKNSGDGKSYGKNLAFTPPEYLRIGKECSRRDLTATHEIFEKAGYQDDEGVTDQDANPRVLCFGLMKNSGDGKSYGKNLAFTPPEYLRIVLPNSVPQALDLIHRKNFLMVMDSCLEGHFSNDDGTEFVRLASQCLWAEPRERPNARATSAQALSLSPLGKECSRRDLTATHEIFEKAGYQDDEGVTD